MQCAQCGTQNRDGARFCVSCGAVLAAPVPPPPQAGWGVQQQQPPPPPPAWGQYPPPPAALPQATPARAVSSPAFVHWSQYALPAGALLLLLGSFLPWVVVREPLFGATASLSGLSEGLKHLGVTTVLAGLVVGGIYLALRLWTPTSAARHPVRVGAVVLVGVILLLTLVLALYVGNVVRSANSLGLDEYLGADVDLNLARTGGGLYLAFFGSLLSAAGCLWIWQRP